MLADERPCVVCGGGDDQGEILLCDTLGCNQPYHTHCALFEGLVLGDWICQICEQAGEADEDDVAAAAA